MVLVLLYNIFCFISKLWNTLYNTVYKTWLICDLYKIISRTLSTNWVKGYTIIQCTIARGKQLRNKQIQENPCDDFWDIAYFQGKFLDIFLSPRKSWVSALLVILFFDEWFPAPPAKIKDKRVQLQLLFWNLYISRVILFVM